MAYTARVKELEQKRRELLQRQLGVGEELQRVASTNGGGLWLVFAKKKKQTNRKWLKKGDKTQRLTRDFERRLVQVTQPSYRVHTASLYATARRTNTGTGGRPGARRRTRGKTWWNVCVGRSRRRERG